MTPRPGGAGVRGRHRALPLVALLMLGLWLVTALPAWAHASLVRADPPDGAHLEVAPPAVTLRFDEPVGLLDDALRVFDAAAVRVDTGLLDRDDERIVAVGLPADLPDGGYVVSYRVRSVDSHPVGGVLRFTVGEGAAIDDDRLAEFDLDADAGVEATARFLRGVVSLLALLAGGVALLTPVLARGEDEQRRVRRALVLLAGAAAGATVLALVAQTAALAGVSVAAALRPGRLGEGLATSAGLGAIVRTVAFGLLAASAVRGRPAGWWSRLAVLLALVGLASFALDGHQRSVAPVALSMAADVVHTTAAAVWLGGLGLVSGLLRGHRHLDDPSGAAHTVRRFGDLAALAVLAVAVSGTSMALVLLGEVAALTATTYGRLLLAKVGVVAVVLAVAGVNRRWLVPRVVAAPAPAAWRGLRRTVGAEVVLLAGVALLTGLLVTQPAPAAGGGGPEPVAVTLELTDELDLDLVVDPPRSGAHTIHAYVLDRTGQPSSEVEDLRLELTFVPEGIGPLRLSPMPAGTGHWLAATDELTFAGTWEVRVVVGLDRFTEISVDTVIEVTP